MATKGSEFFSPARAKAIGRTLHSDLNMWPFELKGEHNEIVPEAVAEILHEMGFPALERNVQSILDEVTECQRLSKGKQQGLLGGGKIGEILRLVNLISSELRDVSGGTTLLELLPGLGKLHSAFSKELDNEQKQNDDDPVKAVLIRSQHDHHEFGLCCESIIEELVFIKKIKKRDDDIATLLRTADAHLERKLSRYKWTRKHIVSQVQLNINDIIDDEEASAMWTSSFGTKLSIPLEEFIDAYCKYVSTNKEVISPIMFDILNECGDGVVTIWSFYRLLGLFGVFSTLSNNLLQEALGGYLQPGLKRCDAIDVVKKEAYSFVVVVEVKYACVCCYWSQPVGLKNKIIAKEVIISRATGAWSTQNLFPAETLRALIKTNSTWKKAVGKKYNITDDNIIKRQQEDDDEQGSIPLHRACYSNNIGLTEILLRRGGTLTASLKTWSTTGPFSGEQTPLMISVVNKTGNPFTICSYLLQCGADPNALDNLNQTALYKAVLHNRHYLFELFHDNKVLCDGCTGAEPLLLSLGPSHYNGGYMHNVIFADYEPKVITVSELLRCYYNEVEDIATVTIALDICSKKVSGDCSPPKDKECLFKMEKINLTARHAALYRNVLTQIKELLFNHLEMLKKKRQDKFANFNT